MPHRATEDRFQIKRPTTSHVCPKCGELSKSPRMFVTPTLTCDGCGAEMRPVEAK